MSKPFCNYIANDGDDDSTTADEGSSFGLDDAASDAQDGRTMQRHCGYASVHRKDKAPLRLHDCIDWTTQAGQHSASLLGSLPHNDRGQVEFKMHAKDKDQESVEPELNDAPTTVTRQTRVVLAGGGGQDKYKHADGGYPACLAAGKAQFADNTQETSSNREVDVKETRAPAELGEMLEK